VSRFQENSEVVKLLESMGSRIKSARLEKNWTQEMLAENAQINDKEVSHIEAGRRNITIETLVKISVALEVKPESLISSAHV